MIIAVDFDGTLCADKYPDIGHPNSLMIAVLIDARKEGSKVILWTCRSGEKLKAAVDWCKRRGLEFDAVNENVPEAIEKYGGDSRKIFADVYIDDKANPYWNLGG